MHELFFPYDECLGIRANAFEFVGREAVASCRELSDASPLARRA